MKGLQTGAYAYDLARGGGERFPKYVRS